MWERTFGGVGVDVGQGVRASSNADPKLGYVVTGRSRSFGVGGDADT